MQELISQVEELGIEINHTTSLVMIFGIIFITAIIVHVILHWVVLRAFENAPAPVPVCGCKLSRRTNYSTARRLRCKVSSSIYRPHSGYKRQ